MKQCLIGGDHAGVELKQKVIPFLEAQNIAVQDFGPSTTESVDYPDFVHPLAQAMAEADPETFGILICGSGNGVCMTANKYPYIRAALAWSEEIAALARKHNDANILCLPARFIPEETAFACIQAFLTTEFEGGRHLQRVQKINYQEPPTNDFEV
ncbi:MAG: ribose 5-phosphate isomerase B [Bacteroidia bacterium]|nr:ribose 5-phosphate isomerase B [Bacteroidia bacterium]